MHLQHTDPEGAVRMAIQMGIKKSVGVHWGTWLMSDEACKLELHEASTQAEQQITNRRSIWLWRGRSWM
jgi:hypothetical protein